MEIQKEILESISKHIPSMYSDAFKEILDAFDQEKKDNAKKSKTIDKLENEIKKKDEEILILKDSNIKLIEDSKNIQDLKKQLDEENIKLQNIKIQIQEDERNLENKILRIQLTESINRTNEIKDLVSLIFQNSKQTIREFGLQPYALKRKDAYNNSEYSEIGTIPYNKTTEITEE